MLNLISIDLADIISSCEHRLGDIVHRDTCRSSIFFDELFLDEIVDATVPNDGRWSTG